MSRMRLTLDFEGEGGAVSTGVCGMFVSGDSELGGGKIYEETV